MPTDGARPDRILSGRARRTEGIRPGSGASERTQALGRYPPYPGDMAIAHEIETESTHITFGGPAHLVDCSCGERFQAGPVRGGTPAVVRVKAREMWKLHLP